MFRPGNDIDDWSVLAVAGAIAVASKYLLAWKKRHIFNPAALGAAVVGWLGLQQAVWWVASESLAIFVAIFGFLILRKLHRFELFFSFAIAAIITLIVTTTGESRTALDVVRDGLISFPILFLGTVMLTEPMTTPAARYWQIGYGALVGVLFGSGWHIGDFFMTPELALLVGNLVVFSTFMRKLSILTLKQIKEVGPSIFEYRFVPDSPIQFKPGQYLEVTLDHVGWNKRGNRRWFSIASSPHEDEIIFGIKHNSPSSAFKSRMIELQPGEHMYAHQLQGSFTLPSDADQKLVFIAGGIGVTPFRSMLQELVDTSQKRDIAFFYQINDPKEVVFKSTIKASIKQGVQPVFVLSSKDVPKNWKWEVGFVDQKMLEKRVPDYKDRTFYISGPPGMVSAYKGMLNDAGVSSNNIVTDYFSGY